MLEININKEILYMVDFYWLPDETTERIKVSCILSFTNIDFSTCIS